MVFVVPPEWKTQVYHRWNTGAFTRKVEGTACVWQSLFCLFPWGEAKMCFKTVKSWEAPNLQTLGWLWTAQAGIVLNLDSSSFLPLQCCASFLFFPRELLFPVQIWRCRELVECGIDEYRHFFSILYSECWPPLPLPKDWQRGKAVPSPTVGPQIRVLEEQC